MGSIFVFKKNGTESVNHSVSGNINILLQFPGNSILKILLIFEIAWVFYFQNRVYNIRDIYLISP